MLPTRFRRCEEFSACTVTSPAVPPDSVVLILPAAWAWVLVSCTSTVNAPDRASFLLLAVALAQLLKLDEMPPVLVSVACRLLRKDAAALPATSAFALVPSASFHLVLMPSNGAYRLTSHSFFGSIWFRLLAVTATSPPWVVIVANWLTVAWVLTLSMPMTTAAAAPKSEPSGPAARSGWLVVRLFFFFRKACLSAMGWSSTPLMTVSLVLYCVCALTMTSPPAVLTVAAATPLPMRAVVVMLFIDMPSAAPTWNSVEGLSISFWMSESYLARSSKSFSCLISLILSPNLPPRLSDTSALKKLLVYCAPVPRPPRAPLTMGLTVLAMAAFLASVCAAVRKSLPVAARPPSMVLTAMALPASCALASTVTLPALRATTVPSIKASVVSWLYAKPTATPTLA